MEAHNTSRWRKKLHEVIYEADTPAGKLFDIGLLVLIVISIILVMLESIPSFGGEYKEEFLLAEWVITIIFSIEYVLRIICVHQPKKYIFSFFGIIDLLSVLPLYLTFFIGGVNALITFRALRLLRIFRILKITRYIGEGNRLMSAIRNSSAKIAVFLFAVLMLAVIAGTMMYLIEGPENDFDSIPMSVYWCIVTLTTVGFGDIAPGTPAGKFLASVIMILGYGIIAVPTGIVSAEYSRNTGTEDKNTDPHSVKNTQVCRNCLSRYHQDEAKFCHLCGYPLNVKS
jgi:voltage-gated potassium channel